MGRPGGARWVPLVRLMYQRLSKWHVEHALMALAERWGFLQLAPVRMQDGRVIYLDLRNPTSMPYVMLGDFPCEKAETQFARSVVRRGDTVLDIGANVGWYSSLLSELVGSEGRVYAFEPNTRLAPLLRELARRLPQLSIEVAALADCDGHECFSVPENWIGGSLGQAADALETYDVRTHTLDSFLEREASPDVAFVKCDAEGAELNILRGATKTIGRERPPMWMMEMSSEETGRFGYHPRDLVDFIRDNSRARYGEFAIDCETGSLAPFRMPAAEPFWFNAVFVPEWLEDRISSLDHAVSPAPSAAPPGRPA